MIQKNSLKIGLVIEILFLILTVNITVGLPSVHLEEQTGVHIESTMMQTEPKNSLFFDEVLLIPDWVYDRVLAFDPYDGSFIEELIPSDGHLASPKCAISSTRDTIFVSDQVSDAVFEYDTDGTYIQTITNLGSSGIDNIRGITIYNNNLYVAVFEGSHAETIQRFDLNGGNQMTWTSTQIDSPFDIHFRSTDVLVTNANSDAIERYDHNGNWLGTFVGTGIQWPSQIFERANGNLYVTGSFSPAGIYEYDQNGVLQNYYSISKTMRGIYELGNGLLLFTTSDSVSTYNPSNGQIVDIYTDGNFQFIHLFSTGVNHPPNEPSDPFPADGATDVSIQVNLSWVGSDPDGDPVTYDVYFGTTNPPPLVVVNQSSLVYEPGLLEYGTTYYWKVIAWDTHHASTEGQVWMFTTTAPVVDLIIKITGGVGIDTVITNNGTVNANAVNWELDVKGGVFQRINITLNGTVDLAVGESKTVGTGLFIGFGPISILATAADVEKLTTGIQIVIFSLVK